MFFISTPGSKNLIGWEVQQSSPTGNCTLKIGYNPKKPAQMKTLYPMDKSGYRENAAAQLFTDELS